MENITVGQIGIFITFLVGLITGIGYLTKQMKTLIRKTMEDQFELIDSKLDEMSEKITEVDMNATKNFLVARLCELESEDLDEIEMERFFEQYGHYHNLGGNSYIDLKVNKLKEMGRL